MPANLALFYGRPSFLYIYFLLYPNYRRGKQPIKGLCLASSFDFPSFPHSFLYAFFAYIFAVR